MFKALDNIKISTKVLAAMLILLAIVGSLGGVAITRLAAINDLAGTMRDNYLPATLYLGKIAENATRYRQREGSYVMVNTAQGRAEYTTKLAGNAAEVEKWLKAYEPTIDQGEDARLNSAYVQAWKDYLALSQTMMALAAQGDAAGATKLYLGDQTAKFDEFTKALDGDLEYNQRTGAAAANKGATLYDHTRILVLSVVAISVLVCLGTGLMLVFGVSSPIKRITGTMKRLAEHDLTAEIEGAGRGDEVGAMAKAVEVFKHNMVEADRLAAIQAAEQEKKEARAQKMDHSIQSFESTVSQLVSIVSSAATELQSTAGAMSGTAEETERQSTAVAASAEQASGNVQTVAAAAEELSTSISEISRQVSQSSAVTREAVGSANQANEMVQGLAASAQRIGKVVNLITDIASQTNLLALNATIEAARAGEAGKGFAVVASEVKNLANQTAKATEEIGTQIAEVQEATNQAVDAIGNIGGVIRQINEITTAIAAAVEQQGAATQEIARNVQQASAGTQDVSANIVGVRQAAGETGAAAGQVLSASGELSHQAESLTREVNSFILNIRAA